MHVPVNELYRQMIVYHCQLRYGLFVFFFADKLPVIGFKIAFYPAIHFIQ